jgi:hypothetical protein
MQNLRLVMARLSGLNINLNINVNVAWSHGVINRAAEANASTALEAGRQRKLAAPNAYPVNLSKPPERNRFAHPVSPAIPIQHGVHWRADLARRGGQ